ncbi:uncharacterized protein LOC144146728 [Haemaphysalis longicornis]
MQQDAELTPLKGKIAEATDDDALEQELEGAAEYNRKVSYAVSRPRFLLRNAQPNAHIASEGGTAAASTHDLTGTSSRIVPASRHRTVALPKLQIPAISGILHEWQPFWDHYSVTIHDNVELTQIEKFKYLLTYLIGDARRAIEGIRLSEANYDVAVSALVQRFGRPELLINEYIDPLLAFKPIRSSTNIDRLRELYDKVHFRVSALEALGVPQEQYAVVLNHVLLRCLLDDITLMYRQRAKELGQGSTAGSATESATNAAGTGWTRFTPNCGDGFERALRSNVSSAAGGSSLGRGPPLNLLMSFLGLL